MAAQGNATFGEALKQAIKAARSNQARLAEALDIDPGQVSRWVNNKAVPHAETVGRIEEFLDADLSDPFSASLPDNELYVSAPISGLGKRGITEHHDAVAQVVQAIRHHVNSLYWPGESIKRAADLVAPDIATERNMKVLARCSALLYLQFAEITGPSSALIELGYALGHRTKTTIIMKSDVREPYMLDGFGGVAARLNSLPQARLYKVHSVEEAFTLIDRNGRELLGLT
jgi:transcriptional regulator with XRE-family HTH domain